ncbi:DUF2752 domain-containing protein [Saccharicrinis sp. FJH62]|uniref:DUF2752 domain-containing protein n=1 Tax=Saccharicrinis sp. FJH62 TaxID=3344657 RepID=UPI0035D4C662
MNSSQIIKYVILSLAVLAAAFIPEHFFFDESYSLCIHRSLLHIECPLCGMSRAAHELTRLRIASAISFNFNIIFLPVYVVFDLLAIFTHKSIFTKLSRFTLVALLAGLVVIYVIRIGLHFGWY